VPQSEGDLGRRITRYANTQNEVSSQDFAFLDPQQHRLRRELQVLGLEYILRSAEVPTSKDSSKVIDVRRTAIALASPNIGHTVVAKREVSRLFSDPAVYPALFNDQTDPLRLSRAVTIVAKVDELLDVIERETDGIQAGVAVHGRRVIAHLVMRRVGDMALKDPGTDLDELLSELETEVKDHVQKLKDVFPPNAYPGNVFKNQSRVIELVRAAGLSA
jgi:AIPR protein